jgi:hypothetical protein
MSDSYATISALVFVVVAFVHLARLVKRWAVQVAGYSVPMSVSWFGMPVFGAARDLEILTIRPLAGPLSGAERTWLSRRRMSRF